MINLSQIRPSSTTRKFLPSYLNFATNYLHSTSSAFISLSKIVIYILCVELGKCSLSDVSIKYMQYQRVFASLWSLAIIFVLSGVTSRSSSSESLTKLIALTSSAPFCIRIVITSWIRRVKCLNDNAVEQEARWNQGREVKVALQAKWSSTPW